MADEAACGSMNGHSHGAEQPAFGWRRQGYVAHLTAIRRFIALCPLGCGAVLKAGTPDARIQFAVKVFADITEEGARRVRSLGLIADAGSPTEADEISPADMLAGAQGLLVQINHYIRQNGGAPFTVPA